MFIWNENGDVIYSDDKERVKLIYGITRAPDATLSDTEWKEAHGIVHVIDGQLKYGYTEAELKAQKNYAIISEITELKQMLSSTDYIAAKIAEGAATKEEYTEQLAKRNEWRYRINELQEQLDVGSNQ